MPSLSPANASGYAAFAYRDFTLFQTARFFIVAATEMQSVAVGWQVYEITKRPLDLGLVGLAQFLPGILLFLLTGHAADRFDRRVLSLICYAGYGLCSAMLFTLAITGSRSTGKIFLVLVLLGVVRALNAPAGRAMLPQLVPSEVFINAVAWSSTTFQAATILGPAIGGFVYAFFHGPSAVYGFATVTAILAFTALIPIQARRQPRVHEELSIDTVFAGFHYIFRHKIILGAISLDLFAVLLGGAAALLPVYAREILHTGPWGLGLLRSAPGVGASAMAFLMAHRPLRGHIGITMMACVAGFGACTIIFGLSTNLVISLIALVLLGASDMVSVIIRSALVQIATPDAMRGRVTAVEMLFIGASNEFGQFESGLTAHWFGTVPAVVLGGMGTLIVIAIWAWKFPELRRADELHPIQEALGR